MSNLKNEELILTVGGAFSATMLGYVIKGINLIMDFGRQIGSSLRRLVNGSYCSL